MPVGGFCIWLTGRPGAGKTTIARAAFDALKASGCAVTLLDGDEWRQAMATDLGFSAPHRDENIHRAAAVAAYLVKVRGEVVICAFVSPREAARENAARMVGDRFALVEVSASVEACIERDPKGMYALALAGKLPRFTGIDPESPYVRPPSPDLVLWSEFSTVDRCSKDLLALLATRITGSPSEARPCVADANAPE